MRAAFFTASSLEVVQCEAINTVLPCGLHRGPVQSHQPRLTPASQKCRLCIDLVLTEKQGNKLWNWCGQYKSEHQWLSVLAHRVQ